MIQKIFVATVTSTFMLMIPVMTVVAAAPYFGQVDTLFTNVSGFIDNVLIPLVFAMTLLIFVWGMFRFFIYGAHSEEDRTKGRQLIIWGIIGMAFMVSIWGIVNIFAEGVFGSSSATPRLPGTPTL